MMEFSFIEHCLFEEFFFFFNFFLNSSFSIGFVYPSLKIWIGDYKSQLGFLCPFLVEFFF
jgi:hypothetical protein